MTTQTQSVVLAQGGDTLLTTLNSRQSDLVDTEELGRRHVTIIGVGAIGSNVMFALASMGVRRFKLVDPQTVGEENIYPAFYDWQQADLGLPKVEALAEKVGRMLAGSSVGLEVETVEAEFNPLTRVEHDIVVIGTDSMVSRRQIWNKKLFDYNLWIDGRIGELDAICWAVEGGNEQQERSYANSLELDGGDLPCGMKATAFITKGWMPWRVGWTVSRFVSGQPFEHFCQWNGSTGFMVGSGLPEEEAQEQQES